MDFAGTWFAMVGDPFGTKNDYSFATKYSVSVAKLSTGAVAWNRKKLHADPICALGFSSDGHLLVSASTAGTLKVPHNLHDNICDIASVVTNKHL